MHMLPAIAFLAVNIHVVLRAVGYFFAKRKAEENV